MRRQGNGGAVQARPARGSLRRPSGSSRLTSPTTGSHTAAPRPRPSARPRPRPWLGRTKMEGKAVGADFSRRKNIAFFSRLPASVSRVGRATDIEHLNPKHQHHHHHHHHCQCWKRRPLAGQAKSKSFPPESERAREREVGRERERALARIRRRESEHLRERERELWHRISFSEPNPTGSRPCDLSGLCKTREREREFFVSQKSLLKPQTEHLWKATHPR